MDLQFKITPLKISDALAGQRLDCVVAEAYPPCSRSLAVSLIKSGDIKVSGQIKKPGYRLRQDEVVTGSIPIKTQQLPLAEKTELEILHEDSSIIVINKQPGMVVHPAPGHVSETLVNALLDHYPPIETVGDEPMRPGIVHRLDMDTSGIMVVAKKRSSFEFLKQEFQQRRVKKFYLAIVSGNMESDSGQILLPIGRHPVKRKMMSTTSPAGRHAETLWFVRKRFEGGGCLVEVELKTGRTHQIRVHFKAQGCPLIGDRVYGRKRKKNAAYPGAWLEKKVNRQMLHAWKLGFRHPWSGKAMLFEAPMAQDMKDVLIDIC